MNLKRNPVFYSDNDLVGLSNFKIRKGDTLMAMTGNTIGNCSLNTSDSDLYLNQRVLVFNLRFYYLTSLACISLALAIADSLFLNPVSIIFFPV